MSGLVTIALQKLQCWTEPPLNLTKKIRRPPNNRFTADCDQLQYLWPIFGGHKIFGGGGCFRWLRGLNPVDKCPNFHPCNAFSKESSDWEAHGFDISDCPFFEVKRSHVKVAWVCTVLNASPLVWYYLKNFCVCYAVIYFSVTPHHQQVKHLKSTLQQCKHNSYTCEYLQPFISNLLKLLL